MATEAADSWYISSFCGHCRFFGHCSSDAGKEYGDDACWEYVEDEF